MPPNPQGPSFSERQKRKQKIVQGDCCPLENPLLGSALAASPDPTAGILDGRNKLIESQQARSFTGKHRTLLGFPRVAQLPSRLFRLFRARDVRNPRSITSPYFALTGQRCHPAWACGPMLGLWGSSGSEMPSHFRKCARLRRAQRGYALQGRALR